MSLESEQAGALRKMGDAGLEFAKRFEFEGVLAAFEAELVKVVGEAAGKAVVAEELAAGDSVPEANSGPQ
jgi:hypothetical protein